MKNAIEISDLTKHIPILHSKVSVSMFKPVILQDLSDRTEPEKQPH